jgi:hypothetical protein
MKIIELKDRACLKNIEKSEDFLANYASCQIDLFRNRLLADFLTEKDVINKLEIFEKYIDIDFEDIKKSLRDIAMDKLDEIDLKKKNENIS